MENKFNSENEKIFLNSLVTDYRDDSPYSRIKKDIIFNLICGVIEIDETKRALQMGCSNGYETEQLSTLFKSLDVVDGAEAFIQKLSRDSKLQNVNFIFSLFEEFEQEEVSLKYDYVFCNYVLEHVYETKSVLKQISKILKPNGVLIVVVPNAHALSRRIASKMGLLNELETLTENDLRHGHRRVYTFKSLEEDIKQAGFVIQETKGVVFKILADFQLNKLLIDGFLTKQHISAMQALSEEPENIRYSDSIFLVARKA
ncbi:class I SAM-dependent methyltransferase [Pontibacter sp. BT310]|uniref:Class I SAM-dependent methyltransferase n=1 Tax=Pontibacter populi TaxID=890055 RepID=A0ABS6XFH4_9BACT|nr:MULTISPECIES: class I SAM-dependent methyltransferase [Pontibacter]MBJ6119788.1 class I SAM-dependent methyltransferase [Pontibacter sp. BT310]MBR0572217.1 class I SAM-dependent methyltransferase [Microvirga sp. STS03]MBW3366641.1 class I SAM-dependent methyltransferase [Pontibacter populi]